MAKGTIAIRDDDFDPTPMLHWLQALAAGIVAWLVVGLIVWGVTIAVSAWLTPAQAADPAATYARLHDGRTLIMPPATMRAKIERQIDRGTAPAVMEVSRSVLRKRCTGYHPAWTGCTVMMGRTPVMAYIVSGLDAHDRRIVVVHELAHYLYGWQHP